MKVTLVVVEGKPLGLEIPLKGTKFSIGRDSRCNLRPNSDLVSKLHCLIEVENEIVTVRDLGSTNGTFLNDEKVEAAVAVSHGDKIRVGSLTFETRVVFEKPPQVAAPAPAAPHVNGKPQASEDPLQWLLADDDGNLLETSGNTTVLDLPVKSQEETVADAPTPIAEPVATKPNAPPKSKVYRPAQATQSDDKLNAQDAAGDILNRYLVRRRPG